MVQLGIPVFSSDKDLVVQLVPLLLKYHVVYLVNTRLVFFLPIPDPLHLLLPILDDLSPDHFGPLLPFNMLLHYFARAASPLFDVWPLVGSLGRLCPAPDPLHLNHALPYLFLFFGRDSNDFPLDIASLEELVHLVTEVIVERLAHFSWGYKVWCLLA